MGARFSGIIGYCDPTAKGAYSMNEQSIMLTNDGNESTIIRVPKDNMARLTVTKDGVIRIKVPQSYPMDKIAALQEVADQVVLDRFGVTMRGHTMVRTKCVPGIVTITMYNDSRTSKKTYLLWEKTDV
jgi:2-C-methyl-D-erythritol 4-phosphate cytidylyltransferase